MKDVQNSLRIYVYNKLILGKLILKKRGRDNVEVNSYCITKVGFRFWTFLGVDNKNGQAEIEIQSLGSAQCLQAKVCNFLNYDFPMARQS